MQLSPWVKLQVWFDGLYSKAGKVVKSYNISGLKEQHQNELHKLERCIELLEKQKNLVETHLKTHKHEIGDLKKLVAEKASLIRELVDIAGQQHKEQFNELIDATRRIGYDNMGANLSESVVKLQQGASELAARMLKEQRHVLMAYFVQVAGLPEEEARGFVSKFVPDEEHIVEIQNWWQGKQLTQEQSNSSPRGE